MFVDFHKKFMCVPTHISGDPSKAPKAYLDAGSSQWSWERDHGHKRESGGEQLGTLTYDFLVRDHLALFRQRSNQNNKTRTSSIGSQTAIARHGVAI